MHQPKYPQMKSFASFVVATSLTFAAATASAQHGGGNLVTGEGIPNPNPIVHTQWGDLPAGATVGLYCRHRYRPY